MPKWGHMVIFILIGVITSFVIAGIYYYYFIKPKNQPVPLPSEQDSDKILIAVASQDNGKKVYAQYDGSALLSNKKSDLTQEDIDSGISLHKVRETVKDELIGVVTGENPANDVMGLSATYEVDGQYVIGKDKVKFSV